MRTRFVPIMACVPLLAAACSGTDGSEPVRAAASAVVTPPDPAVVRFLEQSSFGPTPASIAHVTSIGIPAALTEQLNAPATHYQTSANTTVGVPDQFFNIAVTAPDQLRQRVALALHEILVVGYLKAYGFDGMVPYLNTIVDDAFGNYQQLLQDITLNPAMGRYLNMANNSAFDTGGNAISPNENYARELMQLFSMGLWQLNNDGTLVSPATPTYSQDVVESTSHVLTGWGYGDRACPTAVGRTPGPDSGSWSVPLIDCAINHDPTAQALVDGYSTVDGWSATEGLENPRRTTPMTSGVIAAVANDASVAPFMCKQLIQHLVTSNPAPTYVARCVNTWRANKTSSTQLFQVVSKILTDAAYNTTTAAADPTFGKMREPALYITSVLRLLTTSDGVGWTGNSRNMEQDMFKPPSVFSYFPPNQPLPQNGGGLLGPEFGILDTASVMYRASFVNTVLYGTNLPAGTTLNLAALNLPTTPADMVDWMNGTLLHGTMSTALHDYLLNTALPSSLAVSAMQSRALYLVMTSAEYQIER